MQVPERILLHNRIAVKMQKFECCCMFDLSKYTFFEAYQLSSPGILATSVYRCILLKGYLKNV